MFRSHNRTTSSYSTQDFSEYYDEKKPWIGEEETQPLEQDVSRQKSLIYLLLLAEAVMAASLSAQIPLLITSSSACSDYNAAYLRSLLECAYFFGSTCSVFWGYASDRFGRRTIALIGLGGVFTSCLFMGFATTLPGWVAFRFLAGCVGSALFTSALAMLADISMPSAESMRAVSRLPLISVCGGIGPVLQSVVRKISEKAVSGVWQQWPALNGQIACASLILLIALVEVFCLRETLNRSNTAAEIDSEKTTLLSSKFSDDSEALLSVSIVDTDEQPSRIGMNNFLQAPSFAILLASFSILSLHSSTFEVLLPHLGDSPARVGGMGLPCGLLNMIITAVKAMAAVGVFYVFPRAAGKLDVLTTYRKISTIFPGLYVFIPLCAMLATLAGAPPTSWALFSTLAIIGKELLAEAAHVLVILLAFSAAPNAACAGTGIGLLGLSNLFKALAVGISGISFYLSDAYSVVAINATLWALLVVMACAGTCVNWKLREAPLVGQDIPAELLRWDNLFDAESDIEAAD